MKTNKIFSLLAAIMMAATFTACSNDDNPVKPSLDRTDIDSVIWDSTNVNDINVYPDEEYEKAGIKVKCAYSRISWKREGTKDDPVVGIYFRVDENGGFTFTNTLGKKFTKIELTLAERNQWDISAQNDKLGPGWPSGYDAFWDIDETLKVTWTGKADSVGLLVNERSAEYALVPRIVFYLTD